MVELCHTTTQHRVNEWAPCPTHRYSIPATLNQSSDCGGPFALGAGDRAFIRLYAVSNGTLCTATQSLKWSCYVSVMIKNGDGHHGSNCNLENPEVMHSNVITDGSTVDASPWRLAYASNPLTSGSNVNTTLSWQDRSVNNTRCFCHPTMETPSIDVMLSPRLILGWAEAEPNSTCTRCPHRSP